MAELKWGATTHSGQIRAGNEDNLLAVDGVYVVADGMGGHEAGEVASQIAVERIQADLEHADLPEASDVVDSILNANGDIFRAAIANPGQAGMGTTVTAIAVIGDPMAGRGEPNLEVNDDPGEVTPIIPAQPSEALVLANVGDSRTYLFRHGRLRRVTVDHSYVQELVTTGHITEDEARTHPRRNIITRALGIEPDVRVDWWTLPLIRGDRFLLCSDGLVDEIADSAITDTLTIETDPQAAADTLVDQANAAGGRDNITVIVLDVLEGDDPPDPTQEIDVVPIWADDIDPTPAGTLELDADAAAVALADANVANADIATATGSTARSDNDAPRRRRDRGPRRFIYGLVAAALLVVVFAFFAAWARRGYYVDFDVDDEAIVYRGRTGGVLWFGPTTETTGGPSRDDLAAESIELVEDQPRFDTSTEAQQFVASLGTEGDEPEAPAEPEVESEPPTTQVASDAATRSTERSTITSSPPGTTEAP